MRYIQIHTSTSMEHNCGIETPNSITTIMHLEKT